jgi:hypothetical protein
VEEAALEEEEQAPQAAAPAAAEAAEEEPEQQVAVDVDAAQLTFDAPQPAQEAQPAAAAEEEQEAVEVEPPAAATPPGLLAAVLRLAGDFGSSSLFGGSRPAADSPAEPAAVEQAASQGSPSSQEAAPEQEEDKEQQLGQEEGSGWGSPGSSLEFAVTALSQQPPGTAALATVAASRAPRELEEFMTPMPQPDRTLMQVVGEASDAAASVSSRAGSSCGSGREAATSGSGDGC